MFLRSKESNTTQIVTTITKTSTQAQYENDIRSKALFQQKKCPECGLVNDDSILGLGCRDNQGNSYLHGRCKCGAEWEVKYRT